MYIELGEWVFPGLLEYHLEELGEDARAWYRNENIEHHQFLLDRKGTSGETIGLCSNGAVMQLSYSAATGDPAGDALDLLGELFCTL